MVPRKAAVAAGFATGSSIYSSLEEDADVIVRIAELTADYQLRREQQRAAAMEAAKMVGQVTGISKAWVIQQLVENAIKARDEGSFKESNDALKLIGDEFNMFKGAAANDDADGAASQLIDLDKTEALLQRADEALALRGEDTAEARPPVDMAMVERLIAGNKPVRVADRKLSTGSETDVAMKPESELDDLEELDDEPASEPETDEDAA